ncbi:hypothetical protein HX037_08160 [Ignatzschineria indica]|uniref:hypothetical protein n=1 Tax=Ignatzschineria indica TaxID=472583 RepID=UPI002574E17C|nr:hypothetical protein [Ignatzschineria indica]MDM1545849.1 hypothetical protein [Ignatzschineria indica]
MIYIKDITWVNKDINEAIVKLSDKTFDILCFSHPFNKKMGEIYDKPIYCLDIFNIKKAKNNNFFIEKKGNELTYCISGKINFILKDKKIISLGGFKIDISDNDVPGDIQDNDFIELEVLRFDLY